MQPFGVRDCAPPLTPFYAFFVYFGVVINLIWVVVPVCMLYARVQADFKPKEDDVVFEVGMLHPIYSSAIVANGTLYVGTQSHLYAIQPIKKTASK